jgi:hypothetical protein
MICGHSQEDATIVKIAIATQHPVVLALNCTAVKIGIYPFGYGSAKPRLGKILI